MLFVVGSKLMSMPRCRSLSIGGPVIITACVSAAAAPQSLPPPWLPIDPGRAHCSVDADHAELKNRALRFAVSSAAGGLVPIALDNGFTGQAEPLAGDLFSILPRGAAWIGSRRFDLDGPVTCADVTPRPDAARAAEHRAGVMLLATLRDPSSGLRVNWRATLRDGTNYVREDFHLQSEREIDLARFAALELDLPDATAAGTVNGSPVIAGDRFFGFAHPMSEPLVLAGHAKAFVRRVLPLRAGVPVDYQAVLGVAPAGQLRRGFAAYLENERAAPFRTFLHYNSWFDIGYFTPYTAREAVDVIHAFDEQLVRRRSVTLDSFLFDDGWDDPAHLWQFNAGFPDGFAPVLAAARAAGAAPGMWLSPWGGYGPPREARLKTARAAGYEVDERGLALSGPKYYALFHATTLALLRRYGINQFKLDGTGSPDKVTPGSAFDSDFAAAIALIDDLRAVKPDLFINLTTGTWPSPFWLLTADSIWRNGEDTGFTGTGTNRQRWI
ncbi:MAG TPA: enterotoxin, partial [Burkholderiaceae bacterium]|nr:enterotoxin [Burkholderiaceae bacterium]